MSLSGSKSNSKDDSSLKFRKHNQKTLTQLKKGDLIEFHRGLYSHWGVYVGNEEVIHLTRHDDDGINNNQPQHVISVSGQNFNKASVRRETFWKVVGKGKASINNSIDMKHSPLPPKNIVENAMSKVGEIGYNVIVYNCEHFATWCRCGVARSDQIETAAETGRNICNTIGVVAAAAFNPSYVLTQLNKVIK